MTNMPPPAGGEVSDPKPPEVDSRALSSSVRRGALWVVASNVLLRLANVLITAFVAHILSPHDFGIFAVALIAFAVVSSIGELGVSSCLIRADLDVDHLAPTVATVTVISSTTLAGAMAVFARPMAAALGSAAAAAPIRVLSLAVLAIAVSAVPNAQLARNFKQDKIFLANIMGFVPSTVLLIVLAKSGDGALAFAWSMVVRQLVVGFVLIAVAPRRYRPGFARSALPVILKFGLPLAGANFVNYILLNVDYAFVGHLLGAAALGVYVLAFTVASWPYGVLGAVINGVSMPAFSRVKHDAFLMHNAMASALRGVTLIVMPMCGMTIALAHPIVLTLYGARWATAASPLVILSIYGAVFMPCLLFANMIAALGRTKFLFMLQLIWIGALIPAMALGVHRDGIVGAAYAHVAVILPIVLPSYLLVLKRVTNVHLTALGKAALPAALAASLAAIAAHGAASQLSSPLAQLIAGLAAGGVIYIICAGQQVVAVFAPEPLAERVSRVYGAAGRLVGLPDNRRAKHSADYPSGDAPETLNGSSSMHASVRTHMGRQLAANYPERIASHGDLTYGHPRLDWQAEAVALHERTLADQERLLGPNHAHTLASRANLAYAYCQTGRLQKAIPLYEQALAGWQRSLGPDHPRTLRCSNYLAAVYCEVGRLPEAIVLYERVLAGRRRLLGPDHPSTLRSNHYLATCYREAGRLAESILLYEQAFAGWHRRLGPDHPRTLRSSSDLADAYREAGYLAEAITFYKETFTRCARVLGTEDTMTRKVHRDLGAIQELVTGSSRRGSSP
jgi:lipopolysaccharide exporter